MVFSIDAVCRLGVEEVEGAASYWHGVRRFSYPHRGRLAVSVRGPKWLLAAGDRLGH
jgi:hypothetical protein